MLLNVRQRIQLGLGTPSVLILPLDVFKKHLAIEKGHVVSNDGGELVCLEDLLFQMEPDLQTHTRRDHFLRDFSRALDQRLVAVDQGGPSLLLDPALLLRRAKEMPGMNSKERQILSNNVRKFSSLTRKEMGLVLSTLTSRHSITRVIGCYINGRKIDYIREFPRFKHALGLSDAVDLAVENFNLRLRLPAISTHTLRKESSLPFCKGRAYLKLQPYVEGSPPGTGIGPSIFSKGFKFPKMPNNGHSIFKMVLGVTKWKLKTSEPRYRLLLHYLRVFPKGLKEKDYVKIIKLTLAGSFSLHSEQELPEGFHEKSIPLFPPPTQRYLNQIFKNRRERRIQFYFNLLQSKTICAPVDQEMIDDAYLSHKEKLCRPVESCIPRDDKLYQELVDYGERVGKAIAPTYDPFSTHIPNGKACIEANQKEGGNYSGLTANGSLQQFSGNPSLNWDFEQPRMEPFVIGLFGSPGCGKTTLTCELVRLLHRRLSPELKRLDFVYSRSCSTKHWDGYNGQPVVVLDDFGQDLANSGDIAEFMTLISLNDYVLPMAELSEKGRLFSSKIVIVTSNRGFGTTYLKDGTGANMIEDPNALWRRFDLPLLIQKGHSPLDSRVSEIVLRPKCPLQAESLQREKHELLDANVHHKHKLSGHSQPNACVVKPLSCTVGQLGNKIIQEFTKKYDFHSRVFHSTWFQTIGSYYLDFRKEEGPLWNPQIVEDPHLLTNNVRTVGLDFPISPPETSPEVKVVALSEPLKVRMITVAECDTKVLQPLQHALWKYLGTQPQFCLTNGVKTLDDFQLESLPWFERIEQQIQKIRDVSPKDTLWLSGDYTAATDNFPMWCTEALIEGILKHIDHQPTKDWVRWEISSHVMRYPKTPTGDNTGQQTSGQLMGSLLSFPLLCFLNDFVVSRSGFTPDRYMVNGDDVVAKGTPDEIRNWKELAPQVGLSLSIGKNFIDTEFCSVNSQIFYNGKALPTGKVGCQTRSGTTISYCLAESQYYWGFRPSVKETFLKRNWEELRKTPRSLHLGRLHGGLGYCDTHYGLNLDMNLAKKVYLYDLLSQFSVPLTISNAPFMVVTLPSVLGTESSEQWMEDFSKSRVQLNRFLKLEAFTKGAKARLSEQFCDLRHEQLKEFEKKCKNQVGLFKPAKVMFERMINEGEFEIGRAPPTNFLEPRYIFVDRKIAYAIQQRAFYKAIELVFNHWREHPGEDPITFEVPEWDELFDSFMETEEMKSVSFYTEILDTLGADLKFSKPAEQCSLSEYISNIDCRFWDKVSPNTTYDHMVNDYKIRSPQTMEGLFQSLDMEDIPPKVETDDGQSSPPSPALEQPEDGNENVKLHPRGGRVVETSLIA